MKNPTMSNSLNKIEGEEDKQDTSRQMFNAPGNI